MTKQTSTASRASGAFMLVGTRDHMCEECRDWLVIEEIRWPSLGICTNEHSDHFGHAIRISHPMCMVQEAGRK